MITAVPECQAIGPRRTLWGSKTKELAATLWGSKTKELAAQEAADVPR